VKIIHLVYFVQHEISIVKKLTLSLLVKSFAYMLANIHVITFLLQWNFSKQKVSVTACCIFGGTILSTKQYAFNVVELFCP